MKSVNKCISCNVMECRHNAMGANCSLSKIKVTEACAQGTCCDSYESK